MKRVASAPFLRRVGHQSMSSINDTAPPQNTPYREDPPSHNPHILPLPPPIMANPSPTSSNTSKRRSKLKRQVNQRQKRSENRDSHTNSIYSTQEGSTVQQGSTRTPSIRSTTSSLSEVKNVFSSWVGNLKAGVTGAWTKARGEYDTYLASQEGESRMQRRRRENLNVDETGNSTNSTNTDERVEQSGSIGKRPLSQVSQNATLPAPKKRALKLHKSKSSSKIVNGKQKLEISNPIPQVAVSPPMSPRGAPMSPRVTVEY